MLKHSMARLLCLGSLVSLFLACNVTACAETATPTSGVDEGVPAEHIIVEEEIPTSSFTENKVEKKIVYKTGWTADKVNVKKAPKQKAKNLGTYSFNKKIKYEKYNKKWVKVHYKKKIGYIEKKYIKNKKIKSTTYNVPKNRGYKCGEYYTAITSKSSPQYKLQHQYAYTGNYGIRMVNGRYCVAIGSYFKCTIGQYFTLVLKNGTKIECVKGDEKADKDTDYKNIFSGNGCMSEFLISKSLIPAARLMGDISYCNEKWKSPVVKLIVYKKNAMK